MDKGKSQGRNTKLYEKESGDVIPTDDDMTKILVVEDDKAIVTNLKEFLTSEGFNVEAVTSQKEAMKVIEENIYDLVLLDVSLGDGNGFAVCSAIKQTRSTPVIFLTASDDEYSVVTGLDLGADDYISKPFRPRELVSRIKSVLRRSGKGSSVVEIEDIKVDMDKGAAYRAGIDIGLSALEYRILLVFLNNKGIVLSRTKLLEEIWDIAGDFVNDNTLTVYIKRLREKLELDPSNPKIIKTVRGMGYRLGD